MKRLVFDSGPLISMTMNNLLWLVKPLKQVFGGEFVITQAVKEELVDSPLKTKKFKFEALQINLIINEKILLISEYAEIDGETRRILDLANNCFSIKKQPLRIIQYAEASVMALALHFNADAIVIDERVTRELIEKPAQLHSLIKRRFSGKVDVDRLKLNTLKELLRNLQVLRSVDLVTIAFEKKLLDSYIPKGTGKLAVNPKKILLESLLWGLKTDGCAVSNEDINYILDVEKL